MFDSMMRLFFVHMDIAEEMMNLRTDTDEDTYVCLGYSCRWMANMLCHPRQMPPSKTHFQFQRCNAPWLW